MLAWDNCTVFFRSAVEDDKTSVGPDFEEDEELEEDEDDFDTEDVEEPDGYEEYDDFGDQIPRRHHPRREERED